MPSQKLIEACRRNWAKRGPITAAGRKRLRRSALRNRPWRYSTGPRTPEGKARSRENALFWGDCARVIEPYASIRLVEALPTQLTQDNYAHLAASIDALERRVFDSLGLGEPPEDSHDVAKVAIRMMRSTDPVERGRGLQLVIFLDTCNVKVETLHFKALLRSIRLSLSGDRRTN